MQCITLTCIHVFSLCLVRLLCKLLFLTVQLQYDICVIYDFIMCNMIHFRYNIVFVPFTGVNNRKSCVTFVVGLLAKEDVASYSWLCENFKKAMGHEPICVVTDQDPS